MVVSEVSALGSVCIGCFLLLLLILLAFIVCAVGVQPGEEALPMRDAAVLIATNTLMN